MKDKDCIFCKIAHKEIPSNLIFEDEDVVAFNDLAPQAPTHILIIPKKHYSSILDLKEPVIAANILLAANKIASKKNIKNFRLVINTGEEAGQSVFHLHLHLLSGRKMNWPPG